MKYYTDKRTVLVLFCFLYSAWTASYAGLTREALDTRTLYEKKFHLERHKLSPALDETGRIIDTLKQYPATDISILKPIIRQAFCRSLLSTHLDLVGAPVSDHIRHEEDVYISACIEKFIANLSMNPFLGTTKSIKKFVYATLEQFAKKIQLD